MSSQAALIDSTAEYRLLRLCAGSPSHDPRIPELIQSVTDWNTVINMSIRHSVLPLLYEHLQPAGWDSIPDGARQRLQDLHYKCIVRNTRLLAELNRVLDLFSGAGLQALPVKGPLLAIACYGALHRRRFDDLDLLLNAEAIPKARAVLMDAGYRSFVNLPPAQMQAFIRAGWDVNLRQGDEEYSIDLSTGITPGFFCFRIPDAAIRENLYSLGYQGRSYPAPGPELLLVMLAAHGSYHRWERLIWAADVRAVIRTSPELDMDRLRALARRTGAMRMLELALCMAERLEPLPHPLREMIPDRGPVSRLADHPPSRLYYHFKVRERWRDRMCCLFRYFFAPTFSDWKCISLPAFLSWLYYLIRPFRAVRDAIKKTRALMRGSGKYSTRQVSSQFG
ncbi:MAG TPA: nucleotidyltransferase family protein [Kiritimatiellia bacterium]|nr:nucleotidyltransferase family protein [Kiritimatiellia bacterium]HNR93740.1 nucleotidyltransferase family protein [Kiritimatiellia bacterium]HNS80424.1 nucleotidyltransferase family protein [Kiritimatiellia bacterium]HPA78283.1 nucleotidyltransferase family protein [Kiritimatiellia bacterium]HQQ04217.1 nucleotidyltransferase family protein [Kiritimatiellia bacterium]